MYKQEREAKEYIIHMLEKRTLDELTAKGTTTLYGYYQEAVDILWDTWFGKQD